MHDRKLEEPWEMEACADVALEGWPYALGPTHAELRLASGILYSETVNGAPMRPMEPMRFCPHCGGSLTDLEPPERE